MAETHSDQRDATALLTWKIDMNGRTEAPRASYPIHYFAKANDMPEQILCVRVLATPPSRWTIGANDSGVSVLVTAAAGQTLPPGPAGRLIPHLRAHYIERRQELHIEDIEAGVLVRGQRFLQNTLRQCLELFPGTQSTMLANVLEERTRSLMLKHLDAMADAPLLVDSASGPLALGMAGAGFGEIRVVPEQGRLTYIGLHGRRKVAGLVYSPQGSQRRPAQATGL